MSKFNKYLESVKAKENFITLEFPIDKGDLKELLKEDGYSDTAEEIMKEYHHTHFLSNAYRKRNKIILELNKW